MFRIAICDEQRGERAYTKQKLDEFFSQQDLQYSVDEYISGDVLVSEFIKEPGQYDLIFMDTLMEGTNGHECALAIRAADSNVPIAFLTASRDFAVESYDVNAIAYLLKPIDDEKLFSLLAKLTATEVPRTLTIKKKGRLRKFDYKDIIYIESHGHTVTIHLSDNNEEKLYAKLDDIEEKLCDDRFIRSHKSYLVNMDFVDYIEGDFVMTCGDSVPVRTHSRKQIADIYANYFFKKHSDEDIL